MRVHALQIAYGDDEPVDERVQRVADLVRQQGDADLVVLPELWAPGYFHYSKWVDRAETLDGSTVATLARAASHINAVVHMGSILEQAVEAERRVALDSGGRGMWNTSVVLGNDGSVLATYRKMHRFGFGQGEPTLIDAGTRVATVTLGAPGAPPDTVVGLATCYDLRFPEMFREMTSAGSVLFTVPAAWPLERREHWEVLGRARAIENLAFVVQVNTGGSHGGVHLAGHSQIISPRGEVLAQAGADEEVIAVDIDLNELEDYRRSFPVLGDRRLRVTT